jgi:hypothetical protein
MRALAATLLCLAGLYQWVAKQWTATRNFQEHGRLE